MEEREELRRLTREITSRVRRSRDEEWILSGPAARENAAHSQAPEAPDHPKTQAARNAEALFEDLAQEVERCRKCPLGYARIRAVFGVGSREAKVMFVGEGPGYEEDRRGEPFVGKAGQLLDKILAAMDWSRQSVYIANIVKCHPMVNPDNPELRGNDRPPSPEEIAACRPYLDRQIEAIGPRVIVTLGNVPARVLLGMSTGITSLRGRWHAYDPGILGGEPIKVMPTFHPAALLRNPNLKREVWEDMKAVKRELERKD